jgi:hypothetical protein
MAAMSFALWFCVDRPVDWLRDKIAGRSHDDLDPHAAANSTVRASDR